MIRVTTSHDRVGERIDRRRVGMYRQDYCQTVDEARIIVDLAMDDPSIESVTFTRHGGNPPEPSPVTHMGYESADDQRNDMELSGAFDDEPIVGAEDDRPPEGYATDEYCPAAGGPHRLRRDEHGDECEHCGRPAPKMERAEP